MSKKLFDTGTVLVDFDVNIIDGESGLTYLLERHTHGDWGYVSMDIVQRNDDAFHDGELCEQVVSLYQTCGAIVAISTRPAGMFSDDEGQRTTVTWL